MTDNSDDIDQLCNDIFEDKVDVNELSDDELESVLDRFYDYAENLYYEGDEKQQRVAEEILAVLQNLVDDRLESSDLSMFVNAIEEAESGGSIFLNYESYTVH